MIAPERPAQRDTVENFVNQLRTLDRGSLARLKRCAGRTLNESTEAYGLFYRLLPSGIIGRSRDEEVYFLIATLFPLAPSPGPLDLGQALRIAGGKQPEAAKAIERRMTILLDSSADELPFRLRQTVAWLAAKEIRIDWPRLLRDALDWQRPDRRVQKSWARSYFGYDQTKPDSNQPTKPSTAPN